MGMDNAIVDRKCSALEHVIAVEKKEDNSLLPRPIQCLFLASVIPCFLISGDPATEFH